MVKEFVVDLFCGAGGTSEGIHLADCDSEVVACVNHDKNAIECHRKNHPEAVHYTEDIRDLSVVAKISVQIAELRASFPNCIITVWASLECTNFSKAKGGQSRDADSRTLAISLYHYIDLLNPEFLMIENVEEILSWGPLRIKEGIGSTELFSVLATDKKGSYINIPNKETLGIYYTDWRDTIKSYGYDYEHKIINAADVGAVQSRKRYFSQFAKMGLPIHWPEQTHCKKGDVLPKWNSVRPVLDLEDVGVSIFGRSKKLVERTEMKIYEGLLKAVAKGDTSFLVKYNSVNGKTGKHISPDLDMPSPTVATQGRLALGKVEFMEKAFAITYYGSGVNFHSLDKPCPTIPTKDRLAKINLVLMNYGSVKGSHRSIESPAGTVVVNDKHNLVTLEHFIYNAAYKNTGSSIDKPSPTIIARQDKAPLYLLSYSRAEEVVIPIYEDDTETMIKIKKLMAFYGIANIYLRMFKIPELLKIQGFPEDYVLVGTQAEQKKYIGNAVEVTIARKLFEAHSIGIAYLRSLDAYTLTELLTSLKVAV